MLIICTRLQIKVILQLLTACMVLDYLHVELRARKMFLAILEPSTGKLCRAKISSTFLDDLVLKTSIFIINIRWSSSMSHSDNTCPQSGSDTSHRTDIDKAPRPSVSNDILILSSDICQLNYFQIVRRHQQPVGIKLVHLKEGFTIFVTLQYI